MNIQWRVTDTYFATRLHFPLTPPNKTYLEKLKNIHVNIMPSDFKQNFLRTCDLPHVFFAYYPAHTP